MPFTLHLPCYRNLTLSTVTLTISSSKAAASAHKPFLRTFSVACCCKIHCNIESRSPYSRKRYFKKDWIYYTSRTPALRNNTKKYQFTTAHLKLMYCPLLKYIFGIICGVESLMPSQDTRRKYPNPLMEISVSPVSRRTDRKTYLNCF